MTLNYACTCANGTAPGLPYYSRTMPTFICEETKKDCIDDAHGDTAAEKKCGDASKSTCGTLDPMSTGKETDDKPTATAATTGAASTSTATPSSKPEATGSNSSSSGGGGNPSWGWMAGVIAGLLAFVGALAGGFYWLGKRRNRDKKRKSMMARGTGGEMGGEGKAGPYKMMHEEQGGSEWSVYELHASKEVLAEMDSSQEQSPGVISELPSPNASHLVAELDGRMLPTVTKPATTYGQDDGRKFRMPDGER